MPYSALLQWCVRQSAETENLMTNFERAMEFTRLNSEPGHASKQQLILKVSQIMQITQTDLNYNIFYRNGQAMAALFSKMFHSALARGLTYWTT
jgi:hypothetical protein